MGTIPYIVVVLAIVLALWLIPWNEWRCGIFFGHSWQKGNVTKVCRWCGQLRFKGDRNF
jgi:hypothetical protein